MKRRLFPKLWIRSQRMRLNDQSLPLVVVPPGGWIYTLRTAHGIAGREVAARLGLSRQAMAEIERRELRQTVTLETLRKVAIAMDAQLVYFLRPNHVIRERRGPRLPSQ